MHQVRYAMPPSRIGADLRAMLSAVGPGDEVLGGVALLGLSLPGLNLVIDAVLVLPRGLIVVSGIDLPGPALRLKAPTNGPWLVDGWRLVRPGSPTGGALAAVSAVGARLQAPATPAAPAPAALDLPLSAVVAVGPYVREVVQPNGDTPFVLHPTPRQLVRMAARLARAPHPCDVATAGTVLGRLAPGNGVTPEILASEGFATHREVNNQGLDRQPGLNREPGPGGRWRTGRPGR